jgi:hypothetical protein
MLWWVVLFILLISIIITILGWRVKRVGDFLQKEPILWIDIICNIFVLFIYVFGLIKWRRTFGWKGLDN